MSKGSAWLKIIKVYCVNRVEVLWSCPIKMSFAWIPVHTKKFPSPPPSLPEWFTSPKFSILSIAPECLSLGLCLEVVILAVNTWCALIFRKDPLDSAREIPVRPPEAWPMRTLSRCHCPTRELLSHKSLSVRRTCNLKNASPCYSFPGPYQLPPFRPKSQQTRSHLPTLLAILVFSLY